MENNLMLIKVGGLITTNSPVEIGGATRNTLDILAEVLLKEIEQGRKVVLVPSAHKFDGYGVTDYLEDPMSAINFLRGSELTEEKFERMALDSAELKGLKGKKIPEGLAFQELAVGLVRYRALLYNWHIAKAEEYNVLDQAVRSVITDICDKVRDRADSLYRLQGKIKELAPVAADTSFLTTTLQRQIEERRLQAAQYVLDSTTIDELTAGIMANQESVDKISAGVELKLYENEIRRSHDRIITFGEPLSTILISQFLKNQGISNYRCTLEETGILTNRRFGGADILMEPTNRVIRESFTPLLGQYDAVIVPGFSGITFMGVDEYLMSDGVSVSPDRVEGLVRAYKVERDHGHLSITQLGRGGSESTAAVIAGCLGIQTSYWVKTEVGGILTAKPDNIVPNPKQIAAINYRTAIETGAIQQKAVELAEEFGLNIFVTDLRNLHEIALNKAPFRGTRITSSDSVVGPVLESGDKTYFISEQKGKYLTVYGIPDRSGELLKVLEIPRNYRVNLAEVKHHRSDTLFIFDSNLGGLECAAQEIQTKLRLDTDLSDCAYFRLVGADITPEVVQNTFQRVLGALPERQDLLYFGAWTHNTNAVTLAVKPEFKDVVKKALYDEFIARK